MKSNPLFVDSTRFRGEMVVAEIEVIGVELSESETLVTKIVQKDGSSTALRLEHKMGLRYVGSIRLAYQEKLTIRHCIMAGDEIIEQTDEKKFTVNYTNLQRWERKAPVIEAEASSVEAGSADERSAESVEMSEMDRSITPLLEGAPVDVEIIEDAVTAPPLSRESSLVAQDNTTSDHSEVKEVQPTPRARRDELYNDIKKELEILSEEELVEPEISNDDTPRSADGWSRPIPNLLTGAEIEIERITEIQESESVDSALPSEEIDL